MQKIYRPQVTPEEMQMLLDFRSGREDEEIIHKIKYRGQKKTPRKQKETFGGVKVSLRGPPAPNDRSPWFKLTSKGRKKLRDYPAPNNICVNPFGAIHNMLNGPSKHRMSVNDLNRWWKKYKDKQYPNEIYEKGSELYDFMLKKGWIEVLTMKERVDFGAPYTPEEDDE